LNLLKFINSFKSIKFISWESNNLPLQVIPLENLFSYYPCNCTNGFAGVNCTLLKDSCLSNPCQNGATCFNEKNGYYCVCPYGYSGTNCQENVGVSCLNGGIPNPSPLQNNLIGNYFNYEYWTGFPVISETISKFQRIENIDFQWQSSSPMEGINDDGFYVVWKGALKVSKTGFYDFYFGADDGVRVYLSGALIIENWSLDPV